ncbi:unannotated protein [freshwater metagenome]|uniref:Unannotated protein n=1 Tax=freshwater metagenome TaxID=449393 RepID=A0A6J6MYQ9_9ZZZZ
MTPFDIRNNTFVGCVIGALAAITIAVFDMDFGVVTIEQRLLGASWQFLPRAIHIDIKLFTQCFEKPLEIIRDIAACPGCDGPLAHTQLTIWHH